MQALSHGCTPPLLSGQSLQSPMSAPSIAASVIFMLIVAAFTACVIVPAAKAASTTIMKMWTYLAILYRIPRILRAVDVHTVAVPFYPLQMSKIKTPRPSSAPFRTSTNRPPLGSTGSRTSVSQAKRYARTRGLPCFADSRMFLAPLVVLGSLRRYSDRQHTRISSIATRLMATIAAWVAHRRSPTDRPRRNTVLAQRQKLTQVSTGSNRRSTSLETAIVCLSFDNSPIRWNTRQRQRCNLSRRWRNDRSRNSLFGMLIRNEHETECPFFAVCPGHTPAIVITFRGIGRLDPRGRNDEIEFKLVRLVVRNSSPQPVLCLGNGRSDIGHQTATIRIRRNARSGVPEIDTHGSGCSEGAGRCQTQHHKKSANSEASVGHAVTCTLAATQPGEGDNNQASARLRTNHGWQARGSRSNP